MMDKYLIGEFSDITGISKRMLRHYDKLNLFSPIEINEDNGYRYYGEKQITELKQIQFLRKLGFTLSSIYDILNQSVDLEGFVEILKDKEVSLTKEADDATSSLLMTKRLITMLEKQSFNTFPSIQKLLDWERSMTMTNEKQKTTGELIELRYLMNRDLFMERVEEILAGDHHNIYHFISYDIDNFMHVNDFDGYEVGDLVLQNVFSIIVHNAQALLNESLKENLLARMGGDECSIFLKNSDSQKVIQCVEETIKEVRAFDFSTIGCSTEVTVSCGIAFGKKPKHIAGLQHESDKALIEAKRKGRDRYVFSNY